MTQRMIQPRFGDFPSSRGGETTLYGHYVWEFCPGHPLQNRWGFVAQHRLIGERIVGRPLVVSDDESLAEVVHHQDECKTNNDPSNLHVMTMREHRKHHAQMQADRATLALPPEHEVEEVLRQHSIKNAAAALGWTHMTLRKHFPHLVAKHKRKSPADLSDPALAALVLRVAKDPTLSVHDAEAMLKISARTAMKCCQLHGVEWVKKSKKGEIHKTYRKKPTLKSLAESGSPTESE